MTHYIIIAGGPIDNVSYIERFIREGSIIICADGGAVHLNALGMKPHKLVGDFDSIPPALYATYQADPAVEICAAPDQNSTDLEKALKCVPESAKQIDIFGALGGRMDHQLANILTIENHKAPERFCIHDQHNQIRLLTCDFDFKGNIGDKIGVIPLRDVGSLRFEGLKFPAEGLGPPYTLGWLGTSNEMISTQGAIKLNSGLVIFTHYSAP